MFATNNQLFIFLSCLSLGIASGVVYEFFYLLKKVVRLKIFKYIFTLIFFIVLSILYVALSVYFEFPSFRLYMYIGVLLGLVIYIKSFHYFIAILLKKGYNKLKREGVRKNGYSKE